MGGHVRAKTVREPVDEADPAALDDESPFTGVGEDKVRPLGDTPEAHDEVTPTTCRATTRARRPPSAGQSAGDGTTPGQRDGGASDPDGDLVGREERDGARVRRSATGGGGGIATMTQHPWTGEDEAVACLHVDRELFLRFHDARDPVHRDAIVERFLPLARQLAARYQRPEEPFDDVFQAACFGLLKAVERFDLERGVAFSSYAVPTITGEIKRHFRDRTWSVRVPRNLQELALRVERVVGDLTRERGRQPSVDEVAEAVGVSEEDVLEAMQAAGAYRSASLDAPRPSSDEEAGETLGDAMGTTDDGFEHAEQRATLQWMINRLTPREREIIRLRFDKDLTQAEIAERVGLSQMTVSRCLRHSIERLRTIALQHISGAQLL